MLFLFQAVFQATLYATCVSWLFQNPLGLQLYAEYRRAFDFGFFAVLLSVVAAYMGGVNAILFAVLAVGGRRLGHFKFLYSPTLSGLVCLIFLLLAGACFTVGAFFFLEVQRPSLKVLFLVSVAISLFFLLIPSVGLTIAVVAFFWHRM